MQHAEVVPDLVADHEQARCLLDVGARIADVSEARPAASGNVVAEDVDASRVAREVVAARGCRVLGRRGDDVDVAGRGQRPLGEQPSGGAVVGDDSGKELLPVRRLGVVVAHAAGRAEHRGVDRRNRERIGVVREGRRRVGRELDRQHDVARRERRRVGRDLRARDTSRHDDDAVGDELAVIRHVTGRGACHPVLEAVDERSAAQSILRVARDDGVEELARAAVEIVGVPESQRAIHADQRRSREPVRAHVGTGRHACGIDEQRLAVRAARHDIRCTRAQRRCGGAEKHATAPVVGVQNQYARRRAGDAIVDRRLGDEARHRHAGSGSRGRRGRSGLLHVMTECGHRDAGEQHGNKAFCS